MNKNTLHTIDIKSEYFKAKNTNTKEDNLVLLDKIISEIAIIKEKYDDDYDEILNENLSNFESLRADLWDDIFDSIDDFNIDFEYYYDLLKEWADLPIGYTDCCICKVLD